MYECMFSGYRTTDSLNEPIPFHGVWSGLRLVLVLAVWKMNSMQNAMMSNGTYR